MSIEFDAEDKKLKDIFGDEKYVIPRYQRPYSWTNSEVEDLWNDISREDLIFLGSFVFNYENYDETDFVEVIDGQQRLITLTIFFAVLRDIYKELNEEKRADITQKQIAFGDDIDPTIQDFRLKCGDSLANFFEQYIQKGNPFPIKIKKPEHKRIRDNYIFLKDKITDEMVDMDTSEKIRFIDDLKRKVFDCKIILIKTGSNEDAYSIFETVNARGADLTSADLLKNYIFGRLPKQDGEEDSAKEKWSEIENNVESVKGKLTVSKLIRYFWLSKYDFVPEKKLYKAIKKEIKDYNKLLEEIHLSSIYYTKIVGDTTIEDWEELNDNVNKQRIIDILKALRIMGITQPFPIILALLMNHDRVPLDFSNFMKMLENHHFAFSAICKKSGNVVEKVYYKRALELQEAFNMENEKDRRVKIETIFNDLRTELRNKHYPGREQFIENFMDIEYPDNLIKYIFSKIEAEKSKTSEKTDWSSANIEHILPQDPKEWGKTKKEVKDYVNLLGNLTLVSKKINGSIGNKPLKEKAKEFEKSKLEIVKELRDYWEDKKYKWTEEDIIDRQRKLAEYAYDVVWKFE